jgi:nucleoside-diphosphate-sugar epimerase
VRFVEGDIANRDLIYSLIDRDDISVFHLASVVSGEGEQNFDLAMQVNFKGGRNVFEACRARNSLPRVVFASSIAVFGGSAMPSVVSDTTKPTPQTTYGVTKFMCELMVNDYSRKRFFNGRSARLPTIFIRPGKPNAAASSFASGVFREPLNGVPCELPVHREQKMPLLGYRNAVECFIRLHEVDSSQLSDDRAYTLPSTTYSLHEMIAALERVATKHEIALGPVNDKPDPVIQKIVATWPTATDSSRGLALGLPNDVSLDQVVEDYIADFL